MMRGTIFQTCRKCGRNIGVIEWGVYRKIVVDAEAVNVKADQFGEQYVRIDGSKMRGKEAPMDAENTEMVYRPHCRTCGSET